MRWPWRRRRGELTLDHCRVCDRQLRRGDVWEARSNVEAADDGFGGTWLAICYCRRHKPKGAVRT